jgi:two-component system LytT family sensor kinase
MKTNKWLLRHGLFWFIYFAVNLFNELYLSVSFSAHPSSGLFFDSLKSQLLVLLIKVPAVYYVLYPFIGRWLQSTSKTRLLLECALVMLLFLTGYRAIIQWVIWPYIYGEQQMLTGLQLTARFFYSFLDLLQVVGIAAAIKLFRLRIQTMKREKELIPEKLNSEILHLKAQINPHFLFNTLNSIYTLTRQQAPEAPEAVMQLSKMLRYMLYETNKKTIALEDEIKIIKDYISLQQIRFGQKARTVLETDIDTSSGQVTPLLILPLVENAFKHGIGHTRDQTSVFIRIILKDNRLTVRIKNPVVGASVVADSGEGIGLSNIGRQLQLLYRDYHFNFEVKDNEFVVQLDINLTSYAGTELFDRGR